jgi:hypothetical protein
VARSAWAAKCALALLFQLPGLHYCRWRVSAKTCPNCGKLVVFSWDAGDGPSPETPLCSPISSPDCWPRATKEFESIADAREAMKGWVLRPDGSGSVVISTRVTEGSGGEPNP